MRQRARESQRERGGAKREKRRERGRERWTKSESQKRNGLLNGHMLDDVTCTTYKTICLVFGEGKSVT